MDGSKLKQYTFWAILFGALSLLSLGSFVVVLSIAHGNIFFIKPIWLGFFLLMCFGLCLMGACIFIYLILKARYEAETTVVCPKCGARCFVDNTFCPDCGERLSDLE